MRFAYRLAGHLGEEDPDAMLERMPSSKLAGWQVYSELEPFGAPAAEHRAGVVASVIANCNRDRKKRHQPYMVADFFPSRIPKKKLAPAQLRAKLATLGGGPAKAKGSRS